MAIRLPLFSGVTLYDGAVTLYGGISLTRDFMTVDAHVGATVEKQEPTELHTN